MADVEPATAGMTASPPPPRPADAAPAPSPAPEGAEPATSGMATDDAPPPAPAPPAEDPATAGMASSSSATRKAPDSPAEETDEQRAEKKRKLDAVKAESRQRGKRMFGVMMGTLQRAKREVNKVEQTDAGRKRAELQERLREKLGAERREAQEKAQREREAKDLKLDILRREEELASADNIFRTRQAAKLANARFLCTTFTPSTPSTSTDLIPPASVPRLPHAVKLSDPRAPRPIYYLPYRLLPSQEDRLDDQLDAVRKARDAEQEAYDALRRDKVRELEDARRRRQEREGEIERQEREERQRRRREVEEREEKERSARRRTRSPERMAVERDAADVPASARSPKENGAADAGADKADGAAPAGDDVAMAGAATEANAGAGEKNEGDKEAAPAGEPATAGMNGDAADAPAAAVDDAKMDDELEY